MTHADTIVALCSPIASALRAIIRMSGDRAFEVLDELSVDPQRLEPARVARRRLRLADGIAFDTTVYPFRSPRSSTGEDVIEIHLPASPYLVSETLKSLIELGARAAEPGEFTARAFFNGKLDLTRAEGVAATIAASNQAELDAARQLLGGELARRLTPVLDELVRTLALIEVGIDFVEEDVTFISRDDVLSSLASIASTLTRLLDDGPRIERLSHEPRIVLTGRPNAGKSTLLNALAGTNRAVVSDVAGTTRDALSARITLRRGFITLVDVAGLDATETDTISLQMQTAARRAIETADAVVLLIDSTDARPPVELIRAPDLVVFSKRDLKARDDEDLAVDARNDVGLDVLRDRLDAIAFGTIESASTGIAINARHADAIGAAIQSVKRAEQAFSSGTEFVAAELRLAIDQIGSILGNVSPDDVLGRIFSGFCIGK